MLTFSIAEKVRPARRVQMSFAYIENVFNALLLNALNLEIAIFFIKVKRIIFI